ncbi:hypothetical protein D9758_008542 [Tetrapyrgos nigripes]|uniref:Carboxylic ester hydrolase n=1 Tax=Tetrapyrgos nigripes TaxID=182062 RepID=A0A8H5G5M2_9AGAR|nr:hypothetical protein D9758_008542 [Tetrapyrgos nigripes]
MKLTAVFLLVSATVATLVSGLTSNTESDAPIVDLGYASYQGSFDASTNVTNFLGIRYAAAPLGDLRFRAPQPPANVPGVQQANTEPPECFQAFMGLSPTNPFANQTLGKRQLPHDQTEDCLFLNVAIPGSTIPTGELPVIVWIHGGGYLSGDASDYHGSELINAANGSVVVVSIQYRLGVFGFLAGEQVKENGALNAGLLDQHFALQWVNTHISKFGGLNSKVTIWGESAGAGSVLQQVIAQDGRTHPQLFRAAMTSSTFLPEVVAQTNCTSSSDTLSCLRSVDANTLETVNTDITLAGFFGLFTFVPVVDGEFITQRATEALKQGKVNGRALLAVTNTNEGVIFVNQTVNQNTTFYAEQLFPKFGLEQAQETARQYAGLGSQLNQTNLIHGESIFICPTYYLLNAFSGHSFKGEFAVPPATHGMDIQYYFSTIQFPPTTFENADFQKAFTQSFLAFAISMDPNSKFDPTNITPQWSKYSAGNTEMVFNSTEDGSAADIHTISTNSGLLERCSFWESVGQLTGQ